MRIPALKSLVGAWLITFVPTPSLLAQGKPAHADSTRRADSLASAAARQLPAIVVTATRSERSVQNQTSAVDVAERGDLRDRQISTIDAAVASLPATDVVGDSRYGQEVRISMRGVTSGFSTQRTAILLDGRPLADEYLGSVDVAQFPLHSISRLEIVRGPASVLYGTNAMGGVVNLIPARGRETPQTSVDARSGSYRSYTIAGSHGRVLGAWDIDATGGASGTGGYLRNSSGQSMDWSGQNAFMNLGRQWGDGGGRFSSRAYLTYSHQSGTDTDYERRAVRSSQDVLLTFAATTVRLFHNAFDQTLDWFTQPSERFQQHSLGGMIDQEIKAAKNQRMIAGMEWRHEFADVGTQHVATTFAAFLQDELEAGSNSSVVGSARLDVIPTGRAEPSWRIGINHRFQSGTTLRLSVAQGFRAPTISDRFLPLTVYYGAKYAGNEDLHPERILSGEVGVEHASSNSRTRLTVFVSKAKGFWDFLIGSDSVSRPENVTGVSLNGVEFDGSVHVAGGWRLSGTYAFIAGTYSDFIGREQLVGNRLDDNVRHSGMLAVSYYPSVTTFATVAARLVGNRFTDPENTSAAQLPSFAVVDLLASVRVMPTTRLTLHVDNVFDVLYKVRPEYRQPGRNVTAGLAATF